MRAGTPTLILFTAVHPVSATERNVFSKFSLFLAKLEIELP